MKSTFAISFLILLLFTAGSIFSQSEKTKKKTAAKPPAPTLDTSPLKVNAAGKVVLSKAEWGKRLTRTQFRVARMKGTELPYQNAYWNSKKDGVYQCVCCQLELFDSQAKFDSRTGWPSFWEPLEEKAVAYHPDHSEAEPRTEVVCSRCDAHLGHVFADGPAPTGMRFCLNSASLKFVDRSTHEKQKSSAEKPKE